LKDNLITGGLDSKIVSWKIIWFWWLNMLELICFNSQVYVYQLNK
jgi:hypothetical protein